MDALDALARLGEVRPADPAVLDAALARLEEAIGHDRRFARPRTRVSRRGPVLVAAAVVAAMISAAATFVVVTRLDRPVSRDHAASAAQASHGKIGTEPFSPARIAATTSSGPRAIAAVLTAFSASAGDILVVTKTMRGEFGTLGKTTIWLSPAQAAPGSAVRSRILTLTLSGARQLDVGLTYMAPAARQAGQGGACGAIFGRPRILSSAAAGVPGTVLAVNYLFRWWAQGGVTVQAATVPSSVAFRACLRTGQWSVTGRGVLNGMKVIEIATAGGAERLWVSAGTFLPVRLVSSGPDVDTITFDFRFLPPTAANEAMLTASPPPASFRRLGF